MLLVDVIETYERLTGKLALELMPPSRVIFSPEFATARVQPIFERALSLLAAIVGLIILAPLMVLIALAIKLDSRGPVFFVQQRTGLYRMPFNLIKFRTMHPAEGRQEVEKIRYDFYYLMHLSIWLDIRILLETARIIVSGHRSIPDQIEEASAEAVETNRETA